MANWNQPVRVVTGTITRATDGATGTVPETGLGGRPIGISFQMFNSTATEASFGFTDGVTCYSQTNNAGFSLGTAVGCVYFDDATNGLNTQIGRIDATAGSFDADGFTISWTKTGTLPSETMTIKYMATVI